MPWFVLIDTEEPTRAPVVLEAESADALTRPMRDAGYSLDELGFSVREATPAEIEARVERRRSGGNTMAQAAACELWLARHIRAVSETAVEMGVDCTIVGDEISLDLHGADPAEFNRRVAARERELV